MGNTYRVNVLSPNSTIIFRGKVLRTPVVCHNVYDKEIDFLKLQMQRNSLRYEIIDEDTEESINTNMNVVVFEKKFVSEPKLETKVETKTESKAESKVENVIEESKEIEIEEFYDPSTGENSIIDRLIEADKGE